MTIVAAGLGKGLQQRVVMRHLMILRCLTALVLLSLALPIPRMARGACCIPIVWQDAAAPGQAAKQDEASAAAKKQAEQNSAAIAQRLVGSIDHLIPGEFAADSPIPGALQQAARTLLAGDLAGATEQLNKLAQEQPNIPPAPLILAAMYFTLNQTEPGRMALERAAIDNADYPGVYSALARLSINEGWWASSQALLAQLRLKLDAGTWSDEQKKQFETEYLDALADTEIGQRKLDQAREHLTQLQALLPSNASVPFRLADIDFRQDKIDGALAHLAAARGIDVSLYPPELVLFQWCSRQNKGEDAKRWIETSSTKYPEEKAVQIEYGRFLLEHGNLAEAASWIDRAEKNGANRTITRFLQGQIAFVRRTYQVAEATFRELSLQNPNDVGVRNMLALSLIESDDAAKQQQALELANGNFRFQPNSPQMASSLAWIMYRMGNVQQAKQLLSQVSSLASFPSDTAYYLAQLLIDEGQDAGAAELLSRSLEAPGLFLYRMRAEEDLAAVKRRLAEKPDAGEKKSKDDGQ